MLSENKNYEKKADKGKLRYDLIPPEILEALAEIFTYGFEKYAKPGEKESGWRDVEIERYEAAMIRHYIAWKKGEIKDEESGLEHLKHMLWNAGVMMYLDKIRQDEKDNQDDIVFNFLSFLSEKVLNGS